MAPFVNVTCRPLDITTKEPEDIGKDDLNALLYIVVTLLFYSMGIIIGIITYLKREQADMEEDQVFDLYLSLKQEPFNVHKQERVRQMAEYLKEVEEAKLAREKIEAWNIEQMEKSRRDSATDIAQGGPGYETSISFPGASGAAAEADRTRGASAFLCSLTLGVCEPLLTPEGLVSKAVASGRHLQKGAVSSNPKGRIHGQRHSMPSINHPDLFGRGILRENQRSCHEKRSGSHLRSNEKGFKSIIEFQDLRRLTVDTEDTNEDSSSDDRSNADSCITNESSFKKLSMLNNENVPAFKRAAFASDPCKHNKTIEPDQMSLDKDSDDTPTDVDSSRERDSIEEEISPLGMASKTLVKSDLSVHTTGKTSPKPNQSNENVFTTTNEPGPQLTLPSKSGAEPVETKHSLCEPLTLDQTLYQPYTGAAADVRPKTTANSLTDIPGDTTSFDSEKNDKLLLPSPRNHQTSARLESWRRGGAKSADIPDSRIGVPIRRKEKRHERRGALLFGQKSLHHIENETTPLKAGPGRRGFGRQESTDSYSSRTTDSSDLGGESPKLPPAFDRAQSMAAGPPTTTSTTPPLSEKRQPRRIPKLVRSQTVDSSKSPPL